MTVREFSAQVFEFKFAVASKILLNEHKGSAIRGALFRALREAGCSRKDLTSCQPCPLVEVCPVSFLLATVDETGKRGGDVPRPFTINPPLEDKGIYEAGDEFKFGLVLFAASVKFLPYLLVGLQYLERDGIGAKYADERGRWRRGTLRLQEITAFNPLTGEEQILFKLGDKVVRLPRTLVTHSQVMAQVADLEDAPFRKIILQFLTPTRLVAEGKPLQHPSFTVLVQRLIERLSSLSVEYGASELEVDFQRLMQIAEEFVLVEDRTFWEDLRSYSFRQKQDLSLSGFMGCAVYMGKLDELLPFLIWGQITHVGKDATKGNGWYVLAVEDSG